MVGIMIIYDLQCALGHRFEGWFPSIASFEAQAGHGLVACSVCGNRQVTRIPSGGHIAKKEAAPAPMPAAKASKPASKEEMFVNADPTLLVKAVRHYVSAHFKDVGKEFSEKAIKMFHGEANSEPIYGTATPEQQDKMEEEGVPFSMIPVLPEEFDN